MEVRIVVMVVSALLMAAGVGLAGEKNDNFKVLLGSCPTAADSIAIQEVDALFRIIDPEFHKELRASPSLEIFVRKVEEYKYLQDYRTRPDTPKENEWWEEMMKRLTWGRENLKSTIYGTSRDARWEPVIKLGIPSGETVFERDCWKLSDVSSLAAKEGNLTEDGTVDEAVQGSINDSDRDFTKFDDTKPTDGGKRSRPLMPCLVHVLSWDKLGKEVAFEVSAYDPFPTKIIPWKDEVTVAKFIVRDMAEHSKGVVGGILQEKEVFNPFPELKKPIKSTIGFSVFPDSSGAYTLWISALIRGDQFTKKTIENGRFTAKLTVFDKAQNPVSTDVLQMAGLQNLARAGNRKEVAFPVYLDGSLEAGTYEAIISFVGEGEKNLGLYRTQIEIPSPLASKGMSDALFTFAPGTVSGSGIVRNGFNLYGNPFLVYHRGDTLYPYLEYETPDGNYIITATLFKIRSKEKGGDVFVGSIKEVTDTLGKPWGPKLSEEELENDKVEDDHAGIEIFSQVYPPGKSQKEIFSEELRLPDDLPKGKYWLSIQLKSPDNKQFYGMTRVRLEVN